MDCRNWIAQHGMWNMKCETLSTTYCIQYDTWTIMHGLWSIELETEIVKNQMENWLFCFLYIGK